MWLVIKKTLERYLMLMAKLGKKKKEKKMEKKKIVMIMLVMIEATDVHLSSIRPTASVASAWSKLYIPSAIYVVKGGATNRDMSLTETC